MHSETLRACGILVESVLIQEKGYFLARARRGERRVVVEITPAGSGYIHSWPSSSHLVPPVEARNLPGELRLLVFDTGSARFLWEERHNQPFSQTELAKTLEKTAETLAGLQASGLVVGYAGPENLLREPDGRIMVLAGRRGVPSNPFSPPEAVGRRPSDPRSDVFSLGTLFLRLLAGGDDREALVEAWNCLDARVVRELSSMLEKDPMMRPSGVVQAARSLASGTGSSVPVNPPAPAQPAFRKQRADSTPRKKRVKKRLPVLGILIPAAALLTVLLVIDPWRAKAEETQTRQSTGFNTVSPDSSTDRSTETDTVAIPSGHSSLEDSAVIWVSNGTGVEGREAAFRAGSAGTYSFVYPARAATRRRTSLVMVRRENSRVPLSGSMYYPVAAEFASQDSAIEIRVTDITILLGTDLYHPGINQHYLSAPYDPAGTLHVDIANHGIQYTLEGMGAASWMSSRLNGRAVRIDGEEWVVSVADVRDGDRQSDEVGIPATLEATLFLYRPGSSFGAQFEEVLRSVFQALPTAVQGPPSGVPVPDIHVLLGAP